jgi:parallel beta-helix repeat protein
MEFRSGKFYFETSVVLTIFILSLDVSFPVSSSRPIDSQSNNCISYDSADNVITINCKSSTITDIYNQVNNRKVLQKEGDEGIWILNAAIKIEKQSTLYINSLDTSWLKIVAPRDVTSKGGSDDRVSSNDENQISKANGIEVQGSLKIDSVKLTSWDPSTHSYALTDGGRVLVGDKYKVKVGTPRPYISVEDGAGTTDISNSEIAYLGYEGGVGGGPVVGLTYFGGDGSMIKNNNIHHLYFAFYSNGVGHIKIENNNIHHSAHYGLDPHTGTHDMIIKNNTVTDNGSIGIICSLDCYNISIENNKVSNNTKMGIMFSRNMYNSIARNNEISNEEQGIVISESHDNEIYNNTVSDSDNGIDLDAESSKNKIYQNTLVNFPHLSQALSIERGAAKTNTVYSNSYVDSIGNTIKIDDSISKGADENN